MNTLQSIAMLLGLTATGFLSASLGNESTLLISFLTLLMVSPAIGFMAKVLTDMQKHSEDQDPSEAE